MMGFCPWSTFHGRSPYSFPICEQNLCEWIRQPANTWSNLAFVAVGLYLIFRGRRGQSASDFLLGLSIVFMGMVSFIGHGTGIPLFVALDVTAIFLFLSLLSYLLLLKAKRMARRIAVLISLACFLMACAIQIFAGRAQIFALILFIVVLAIGEGKTLTQAGSYQKRRALYFAFLFLGLAVISLGLDSTKTLCSSDQHFFQFHALWHVLSAISMLFIANDLRPFRLRPN